MRSLILVRHALPAVVPTIPSAEWLLSAEGRGKSAQLALLLAQYRPDRVVTSREPKAVETGTVLADQWGIVVESRAGLHEHDRSNEGYVADHAAKVREFLDRQDELVYGRESAAQASQRFEDVIDAVLAEREGDCVVCVAHGTVISLFAQARAGADAFAIWSALKMPCALVFSVPDFNLQTPKPICVPDRIDRQKTEDS